MFSQRQRRFHGVFERETAVRVVVHGDDFIYGGKEF